MADTLPTYRPTYKFTFRVIYQGAESRFKPDKHIILRGKYALHAEERAKEIAGALSAEGYHEVVLVEIEDVDHEENRG